MAANELRREESIEGKLLLWLADWLTVLLLAVGMVFPCLAAYGVSGQRGFDTGAVMAFCVFGSLAAAAIFTWRRGYWAALGVLAVGVLIFWRLWARLAEDWSAVRDPELRDLFGSSPGAMFLLYALVVLTLGWIVVRVRAWWLAAVLVTAPLLPAIQAGILPAWGAMLAGFTGWGALLLTDLFGRRDRGSLARARLLGLGGMAALTLLLVMALPREGYMRPQWATDARDSLLLNINRQLLRFFDPEDLQNNPFARFGLDLTLEGAGYGGPGGTGIGFGGGAGDGLVERPGTGMKQREDLTSLGPRQYAGRLLLRLDTDQPDAAGHLYLRGASFGIYTGTSWESTGGLEDIQPERFPPGTAPDAPSYTMRVRDEAFSGTWYYPYRYDGAGQLDSDGRLTLEEDPQSLEYPDAYDPQGHTEYRVSYRPGGPADGFTPLTGRWAAEEESFRYSLPEDYLEVPPAARAYLTPLLEEVRRQTAAPDPRLPEPFQETVAAAARTAAFLASAADYDIHTPAMGAEEDFTVNFLTEGRGFCVHFATAGAMLLRLQGIPARYVNGYVAEVNSQGRGTVLDRDAHAWVEIYLDGYGWYPVEMTPGYTGGASGVGLEGAAGDPESGPGEDPEEETPGEEEPDPEDPEEDPPDPPSPEDGELPGEEAEEKTAVAVPWKVLFGFAVFWAALCAAYLLALLGRGRARKDGDTNRSVLNAYGRYKRLRRWGCGEDDELERLAKKAKFSQHTLTEEERESAWKCLEEDVRQSRVGQPLRRRWMLAVLCPFF